MSAWGKAWGDSWGWSWGPLHEVEEHPGQVYGNGRKLPGPGPDPLIDGPAIIEQDNEEELIRIVRDKWDAIEAANAKQTSISHTRPAQRVQKSPKYVHVESVTQAAQPVTAGRGAGESQSMQLAPTSDAALLARKRADEEAFVRILAEAL